MNIREAEKYIESLAERGTKPGLDRIRGLCRLLGDPQNDLKFIHIAGTNGKGSVSSYIYNILLASGIKAGCFTSPAVFEYRERFSLSGRNVSQAALCRNLEKVKAAEESMTDPSVGRPSQFEVETALAFMIFKEAGCQIVVLECGMGGQEDSTNIIGTPLVSVITSISMDHMQILGKTIDQIARQKAGIIKPRGHLVTCGQDPAVINVLKAKCSLEKADITIVSDTDIKNKKCGLKGSTFDLGKRKGLKINNIGIYQPENAALAVTAVDALKKEKIKIEDRAVYQGLENSLWQGRFQVISKKPLFIIDGAHNEDAAKRLEESVEYFLHNQEENKKLIFIFGVLADKNYDAISKIMTPHAAHVITITPPNNSRALSAVELAKTVSRYNQIVTSAASITEALEMAYLLADDESAIVAFGSLSFLGEIKKQVEGHRIVLRKKETRI